VLLAHALRRAFGSAGAVGSAMVVADALDDASTRLMVSYGCPSRFHVQDDTLVADRVQSGLGLRPPSTQETSIFSCYGWEGRSRWRTGTANIKLITR
jgi:hypothetical protein